MQNNSRQRVTVSDAPSPPRGSHSEFRDVVSSGDTTVKLQTPESTVDTSYSIPKRDSVVYVALSDIVPLQRVLKQMVNNEIFRRYDIMTPGKRGPTEHGIELPSVSVFPYQGDDEVCFWCGEQTHADTDSLKLTQGARATDDRTEFRHLSVHLDCVEDSCSAITDVLDEVDLNEMAR